MSTKMFFISNVPECVVLNVGDAVEAQVQDPEIGVGLAVEGAAFERRNLVVLKRVRFDASSFCQLGMLSNAILSTMPSFVNYIFINDLFVNYHCQMLLCQLPYCLVPF
jgi:hypothetical protein